MTETPTTPAPHDPTPAMQAVAPTPVASATAPPATAVSRGMRETIESIAIALALAFLFKTFEAEAFVIPTGSMAPTLMGRHKDVDCPECGFRYSASGSDETDENGVLSSDPGDQVVACTCPLCRYTMDVDPLSPELAGRDAQPSYSGDRIWVSKVPYHFSEPRRFDVVVFRFPLGAETYYIKRLVGLPGETIKIQYGDLFVRRGRSSEFEIIRKPPDKLLAMAQVVHDSDYVSQELIDRSWPARWQSQQPADAASSGEPAEKSAGAWRTSADTRTYSVDGTAPLDAWLRYRHTVPSENNWFHERWPPGFNPRPQLITDFYAFNTRQLRKSPQPEPYMLGLHWVGDLILDCTLDVESATGSVLFDLAKGGRHFGCTIDVATGAATLSIDGRSDFHPTAQTAVRGAGSHQVAFANVDRQLHLWVDGKLAEFDAPTTYDDLQNDRPQSTPDDPGDLAPLGVGSRGAALSVSRLRVLRDIYYIADNVIRYREPVFDYDAHSIVPHLGRAQLADFFASPELWQDPRGGSVFDHRVPLVFELGADQFFVLGDNSPASSDARLWAGHNYVDRELLVGKALFIYWPHPLRLFVPFTDVSLGIVPNVGSMGFIR